MNRQGFHVGFLLWLCILYFVQGKQISVQEGMSNSVTGIEDFRTIKRWQHRSKRQAGVTSGLTQEQKIESVNIHNELRRLIPASNMEFMVSDVSTCYNIKDMIMLTLVGELSRRIIV